MSWMGWRWALKVVYHKQSKLSPHTCDIWLGTLTLTHSVVMVTAHHHCTHTLVIDNSKEIKYQNKKHTWRAHHCCCGPSNRQVLVSKVIKYEGNKIHLEGSSRCLKPHPHCHCHCHCCMWWWLCGCDSDGVGEHGGIFGL